MNANVWPVTPDRPDRLLAFHHSPLYPAESQRHHAVSEFWGKRAPLIRAFAGRDAIAVVSFETLRDPAQVAEKRSIVERQKSRLMGPFVNLFGRAAGVAPRGLWKRIAVWSSRLVELTDDRRDRLVAERAFRRASAHHHDPMLTLGTLDRVPALAEQMDATPGLVLYTAAMVNAIGPYIQNQRVRNALEIGPASALLAIALHTLYGCRFTMIDLPEVYNLTFPTISHYLPHATVALPNEINRASLEASDFVLLVPEQTDMVSSGAFDLAINTSSFQEMNYELIAGYFVLIERALRSDGLFYCHNEARFARHGGGKTVEFERYPWSPRFTDVFYEDVSFWRHMGDHPRKHRLQSKIAKSSP